MESDLRQRRLQKNLKSLNSKKRFIADAPNSEDQSSTSILEGVKQIGESINKQNTTKNKIKTSLVTKLTLSICLILVIFNIIHGVMSYSNLKKALSVEINRKGFNIVMATASLAEQYMSEYSEYNKYLNGLDESQKNDEIINYGNAIITKYQQYLKSMLSITTDDQEHETEIMNIAFVSSKNYLIPTLQAKPEKNTIDGTTEHLIVTFDDTEIETDIKVINSVDNNSMSIRTYSYEKTYTDADSETIQCTIYVILSSQNINITLNNLIKNIILTIIIILISGFFISWSFGKHITLPITKLIKDIECVAKGDLNHKTMAISSDEIGALAQTFNAMTQNLQHAHKSEQNQVHELEVATDIQTNLLPKSIPNIAGYDIAACYYPAKKVGGDYYDFIPIDQNHIGFIIADVSGKSIPGSMVMTMTRTLIRMEAGRNYSPGKTLIEVNRILAQDIPRGMFVTALYGILDTAKNTLTLSSAGHNPAYIWRNAEQKYELKNLKGMALGIDSERLFSKALKEETILLQPKDRFVFYTDGVPEAMNAKTEEYGDERFFNLMSQKGELNSNDLINTVVASLANWRGNYFQSDDITMIAVTRS